MSEEKNLKKKESVLIKHNTLVWARYSLTPNECRLFTYILYKIQRAGKNNSEKSCIISQEEIKKLIPDKNKNNVKGIITLLKSLKKNDISIKEQKENEVNAIWSEYSFISGYEFDDELLEFKVVCADKVFKILMEHDYKKNGFYTPINLLVWFQFKLSSTQRLYELLRLWSNTKTTITYSIEELRELLMLENKYSQYRDFKRRIIIPAIEELNEIGGFEISIKERRTNKNDNQVTEIDFIVKDHDKRIYFDSESETKKEINYSNNLDDISFKVSKNTKARIYIPEKNSFTATSITSIRTDFCDYDFKDSVYEELFIRALNITLKKDNVVKVGKKQYNYFKTTLNDLIDKNNNKPKTPSDNNVDSNSKTEDEYVQRLLAKKGWF